MAATLPRTTLALSLAVLAAACGGGGGGGDGGGGTPDTQAPTVASIDPADAATGASRAAAVVVTFSEAVDPATVTAATVALTGPSGAVACTRTLSAGDTVVTLAPLAPPLAAYALHTVQVGTGVRDAAGNALAAPAAATFRTADDVGPAAPAGLAGPAFANLADPAVTFTWNEPADEGVGVVTSYDVEVATSGGAPFAPDSVTTTSYALGDQSGRDGQWLQARVRGRDAEGNAGAWSGWSAWTRVDVTAPTATLDPADAATGVSRTADLAVTFSEPMDAASLPGAVALRAGGVGGSSVPWTGTPAGSVLPLSHAELANHALYALSVGTAATDLAGNPLALAATATFRTADTVAPEAPAAPSVQAFVNVDLPTFTFSWDAPSDDGAGIASYDWVVATDTTGNPGAIVRSGAAWLTATATIGDLGAQDGATLHARVCARDQYGNLGALGPWSASAKVDLTAPTAALDPADGAIDAARAGPFHVTFSEAVVPTLALDQVVLETAGGTAVPDSRSLDGNVLTLTPSAPLDHWGEYRIRAPAQVRDLAWNALVPASSTFRAADDAPPELAGAVLDPGTFASTSVSFSWPDGATDVGSGVAGYEVRVAVGAEPYPSAPDQVTSSTSFTYDAGALVDGSDVRVEVRAVDVAGNASAPRESDGVVVDGSPPVATQDPQDGGDVSASTDLHFQWTAHEDATSGVAEYECAFAEGAGKTPIGAPVTSAVPSCDFTGTLGQQVFVRVRARDAVGNWSGFGNWSDGILLDASAPGTPGTPVDEGDYSTSSTLAWTWTPPGDFDPATDSWVIQVGTTPGGSGAASEETAVGAAASYQLVAAQGGSTYYLSVAMKRGATTGASSAPSDGITVDTSAPGAPGTPARVGLAGAAVTFAWTAAVDPESGVSSYEVAVYVNAGDAGGVPVAVETTSETSHTWSGASNGDTVRVEVRATNRAGATGPWSPRSAPVTADTVRPSAWSTTPGGTQPTNLDVVVAFSEQMDTHSVEAAFSLTWDGASPRHGYAFHWSADLRQVTVVPDTEDPQGETNVDLLPESTDFVAALATSATDAAGNPLDAPLSFTFRTRDETAPALVSVVEKATGLPSPFDPDSVRTAVTLLARFDEEMSAAQASVRVDQGGRWLEGGVRSSGLAAAAAGGGGIAFTLASCTGAEVRLGDLVSVRDTSPRDWEVTRAQVTAFDPGTCTVTVAAPVPAAAYASGGWMAVPATSPDQVRVQWTGPQELQIELPPWFSMAAGSEARLELWNLNDLSWNWTQARTSLQVRSTGEAVPPRLLTSIPRDGAAEVAGGKPVVLRFSEPLSAATISGISATCSGCPAGLYAAEYNADEFGPLVLVVPSASPPAGALVTVHVPGTVEDLAGNAMGAAVDVSFTVESALEGMAPQVRETNPPSGVPVDQAWGVEVAFEDSATGMLEAMDPRSMGANDVRVVDVATGVLVRGFRLEGDPSSAIARVVPPSGSGLSTGQKYLSITSAVGSGGVVTYTTLETHDMPVPGGRVWVQISGAPWLGADGAEVTSIPGPNQFQIASPGAGTVGDGSAPVGNASVPAARSYEVSLGGVPGSDGILDASGNALDPAVFQLDLQPWPERAPSVSELRSIRLEVSTSPVARALSAEVRVRDPDLGSLDVSLYDGNGGLTGTLQTVSVGDPWSGATYRYPAGESGGGGPPTSDDPPELASYDSSGYQTIEILVDDGSYPQSYLRDVWVWAPADVPRLAAIDDGGTVRAVGATPLVLEATHTPAFAWTNMDEANADLAGLYVISLEGVGDGPAGFREAMTFAPVAAGTVALATALEPDVYLWTAFQQKVSPGTFDLSSSGWAIDLGNVAQAMFAVGPDNRDLGGATFAGARMGFDATGAATATAAFGALGTFAFEAGSAGAAPVRLTASLRDQRGGALPAADELFAFEGGRRFTMTQAVPGSSLPLPLPMHGVMGMARDLGAGPRPTFFAVAQEDRSLAGLQAGALRFQESGFGTALDGPFVFVQASASVTAGAGSADASVGRAAFDPGGAASVSGVDGQESAFTMALPYTLGDDGLLAITVDLGRAAEGLLGGAPGEEIGALATVTETDDRYFWLLVAREYGWTGGEDASLLNGTYRFADFGAQGPTFGAPNASSGTMTFDGAGNATYEGTSWDMRFSGYGSYTIDPTTRTLTFTRLDALPGARVYTGVVGPNADVLLAAATDAAAGIAEVMVLAR